MNVCRHLTDPELLEILTLSPYATAVYTTEQIIIETANDAMLGLWGKDRSVIGKSMGQALPELKEQPFIGLLQNVWRTGQTYEARDTAANLIVDGKLQTFYFDFTYRAVKNQQGEVYCILHTAVDVTERRLSRQVIEWAREQEEALLHEQVINEELAAANEELSVVNEELQQTQDSLYALNAELEYRVKERTRALANSESRARFLLSDAPVAIGVLTGPELIIESANHKIIEIWGKNREVIGKPLRTALPELAGQPFFELLDEVYNNGEPFEGNEVKTLLEYNHVLEERYFNFVYHPLKNAMGHTTGIMVVAIDVTEQVKARRLTEENETRFRFLLNAMPQQVWTAGADGIFDYVNQIVCNDFGKSGEEIVGLGWQAFIHPDDLPGCLKTWQKAMEKGDEYMAEFRLRFKDGGYRWHLSLAVPLIEAGKIKLWLGTNTNIDIQKNNEQRKDEFLSIASHELKTPLTSIKAFNQLMQRTKDEERLHTFLRKSAGNIQSLERLVNDLLDVTKINAGKMNYTMEPFSFGQMLADSIENVQHTTNSHLLIMENTVELTYEGDRFRLEQVMHNFLSNAIKYSPEGKEVIINSWVDLGNVIVSVQDFGIGIAANNMDHLFDRYYRADNTAMRFEGLGLGLFISSEILKRHQGSFWIESEEGKGSTFYFRLPLPEDRQSRQIIKFDGFYQDSSVTVTYNESCKRLDVNWTGFQNMHSMQNGCLIMLDMLIKYNCSRIINDNRQVLGTWSDAAEWVGETYFPMMEKAGVKYLAWVFSPSIFSQLSAKKSIDMADSHIVTRFFTDILLAEEWLDKQE